MTPEEFSAIQFDYIVIGGGAAGLVVAARLSEDSNVTVGVLEAGGDQSKNPMVAIPGLALQTFENPDLDWAFMTVPQVRYTL
jgi:choline dehydrogenase